MRGLTFKTVAHALPGRWAAARHCADAECDGDDLLRLNGASVGGLLEAVNGMAELIELRLGYGTSRARQTQGQGGGA